MELLNYFFHVLHILVIIINLSFWAFPKTRKIHLFTLSLTWLSWLVFGVFYGFGYCFLTDWHWQVKAKLGENQLPLSYITYLTNNLLGFSFLETTIYWWTIIVFALITLIALILILFKPKA